MNDDRDETNMLASDLVMVHCGCDDDLCFSQGTCAQLKVQMLNCFYLDVISLVLDCRYSSMTNSMIQTSF